MKARIVLVVYRPFPGKEKLLEEMVAKHLDVLRREKLVTSRRPVVMKTADGAVVEIFEWVSAEAIESAHKNANVQLLWNQFATVCDYDRPTNSIEFHNLFSEFEPLN